MSPVLPTLLLVLGCAEAPPPPPPDPERERREAAAAHLPACVDYVDRAEAFAYCLYTHSEQLPSPVEVSALCPLAGRWETGCRHNWVAGGKLTDPMTSLDTLLEVCGQSEDCAFDVLDRRPSEDTDRQLALCEAHAGRFAADCVGHALQRWFQEGPEPEQVAARLAAPTAFPDKVGWFVGAARACAGEGPCAEGPDPRAKDSAFYCRKAHLHFSENPESCADGRSAPGPGAPQR